MPERDDEQRSIANAFDVLKADMERAKRRAEMLQAQAREAEQQYNELEIAVRMLHRKVAAYRPRPLGEYPLPQAILVYLDGHLPADTQTIADGLVARGFKQGRTPIMDAVRVALGRLLDRGKITKRNGLWCLPDGQRRLWDQ